MKYRHNTRQNQPIVNVTDGTSDAIRSSTLVQPVCTTQHNTSRGLARTAMCAFVLLMLICGTTPVVAGYPVPVDTVNGISGFLNTTIPSNSSIDTYTTAGIDTVESTLDWDAITSGTWNSYLASAQYCYDNDRRAGMRMNVGGDYASSTYRDDVKTNITSYLPDLKSDPHSDTIQYIVINLTNPSGTSRTAFVNEIGQEICEQTDNKFKVVVVESLSGLDSAYVSESPVIYKSLSTVPDWIDFETDTLRGNTTLSRVYSGSESFLSNLADYRDNILNRLRDTPNISNHYSETYSVKIGDGDIVLFNNGSSRVKRTVANAPSGYYWASINDTMVDISAGSATIGFYIPALSFDYILKESSLDHITYISDSSSQLWNEETITDEHIEYHDGVMDTNYVWLGNDIDIRAEFWDPEYTRDNTFILHYEWINASPIKEYYTYDYIVIADKNANEITNTIARLNDTYGYVSLGDYGNSEVWQTNKIAAIDDWIDNYDTNLFLDEIDFAASGDNSSSRLKDLVDHIHSKDKKVFMNIYTYYKEFGTYGDVVLKESCFSRWGGDVNNPTYAWEEMWIEKERADYYTAHNITVAGLSLGSLNDYDKMAFDYAAFAVLYGLTGNNSYRYGQPNFQSQKEIMVYPLGMMLEPSYTETSPTDWNRLYQAGRVHINPVDHTWWVDDNKEPSNLTVSAYFYGGGDFGGGQHVKVFANSNESTSTIYFNNGVDPLWTWVWRSCELDKSVYETHGHYYVYMYYRGVSGGWNFFGEATELTPGDAKTWFDTTSNNLPATTTDQTWIGLATYNFMINLAINYTSSENVDELVDRISQTPTTTKSGGVVTHTTTISSDKDLPLPVWSGIWNISAYSDSNAYANDSSGDWVEVGVNDVPDASADTLDWYYTTVDGEQYGLVRESRGNDMYLYRFLLPHTSIHTFMTNSSMPVPADPTTLANATGNFWVNHTWAAGSGGNATDSYSVLVNSVWHNGTTDTFCNGSHSAHAWQNITVYAFNSSGTGTLSTGSISDDIRIPNNPVTITNTSDWSGEGGGTVYVDCGAADADSDTPTFSCNRTDLFTDWSTSTGKGNWTAVTGTYYVDFGVSDGYCSTDNYTMMITASALPEYIPPDPVNIANTTGDYWVNYTWSPGMGNVTDSYNVDLNGVWTNETADAFVNVTFGPSGWTNITVFAYNASGAGTLSEGSVSDSVQAPAGHLATIYIEDVAIRQGENKTVPIMVFDVANMSGCELNFTYNPAVVYVTDVARGDMNFSFEYNINNGSGWMRANALDVYGQSGNVTFAYVTLAAVGNKSDVSEMEFEYSRLLDASFGEIAHTRDNGTFSILPNVLPEVTNVSGAPGTILYDNGRPRTPGTNISLLSAYVADADGNITAVTINLSSIGGSPAQPMEPVSGDLWTLTTNATEVDINAPNFTHQLTITATDNDGGINDSVSIELTVLKRGDVNGDGLVDKMDADYISRYLAGLEPEAPVLVGDVIGDAGDPVGNGVVDLMDALYIAKYTSGIVEEP